ncbi:MAG: DUF2207 domain-containing protein [Candidatus Hydrogenedentes bacterium]|nr:DUF2207 domain-containing protein [Candidatus Hydrogenedentota bacterium]
MRFDTLCGRIALSVCLFVAGAISCFGQEAGERILRFHSDVTVHEDASLTVRETISILSEGNQIQHGIYRDFPTRYRKPWWRPVTVGFDIISLERDGVPEPYHTEDNSNGVRTYFGSQSVYLTPGEHIYIFTYKTDRQLGFFDKHDEVYWNATGNDWEFLIDEASATVHLPIQVPSHKVTLEGYTGPQESKEQAVETRVEGNGDLTFKAKRPLAAGEGLTIVATFPKGIVTPPPSESALKLLIARVKMDATRFTGCLLVLTYFVTVWVLAGRDPMGGAITVQPGPPPGISPAAARFVSKMGFDNTVVTCALVSLAVKGFVEIEEDDSEYRVTQLRAPDETLPAEERALLATLITSGKSTALRKTNHKKISAAITACHKALKLDYEKTYFLTNWQYWLPGLLLSVIVAGGAMLTEPQHGDTPVIFLSIWLGFWSIGVLVLGMTVITLWKNVLSGKGGIGQALFMTLFATPFFAAEIFVAGILIYNASLGLVIQLIVLALLNLCFYQWMKAPTRLGRQAMDHLEGYKRYLAGDQQGQYGQGHIDEVSPEMFEEHLAYALALDAETPWAERLTQGLDTRPASTAFRDRGPLWYRGSHWNEHGGRGFATALGTSMASAIASSATAPGSSSGSGGSSGGGSSGGGGGGGGGGGW